MPFVWYFAVTGSALVGLLFVADATLPDRGPLTLSSEFHGVSATLRGEPAAALRPHAEADLPGLAPAPDMKSPAIKLAREGAPQTNTAPNLEPVNRPVASAEPAAPKKRKPVARPAREAREQIGRSGAWRGQYAQANDHGWNWGSNNRSPRRDHSWDSSRNDSWRNDFWRNDRPWR